jgi:PAS domain S-box-containing protein
MSGRPLRAFAAPETLIRLASLLCALVIIGATVSHVAQLRRALQAETEGRLQSETRMLARELDRTLGQTSALLEQADELVRTTPQAARAGLYGGLAALTRQQFLLRELAVIDGSGRVVASSDPASVGLDLSGHDFARAPSGARVHLGLPKRGRSFARAAAAAEDPAGTIAGFITVSREGPDPNDRLRTIAVIGTDSLLNELSFLTGGDPHRIALYRYDGALLAAQDRDAATRRPPHPIFTSFLPNRETGGFVDQPGDGRRWIVHFDTLAELPVVVESRAPQSLVVTRWERELVAPGAILLLTLLALIGYTRVAAGALRQRARSQEQAATQERRLRNIVDTAADGIVTIDGRGVVREYNRAAESIFGVPAAQAVGRALAELLPAEEAQAHRGLVERHLQTGVQPLIGHGLTLRTVRHDGRPLELHLAVSEVVDQGERLFTGIVRDVTDARQAEQRFRTLFERSAEPHLLLDAGGIVDCNDAAAMLLRAPERSALLGLRLEQLAPPRQPGEPQGPAVDSAARVARAAADARSDGVGRLVWTARALDGTEVPVDMTMTPIRLGDHDAMLVSWHDIAERRRHEEGLRQARDAAEAAAQAKARFLAMMSHELRTPMTGIIGVIDLLRDSRLDREQQHLMDVLRNSADGLLTVLNDVLDYSKIEAGRLEFESIDFRPASVAREVIDLLSHAASQRGNRLNADWNDDDLPALRGDPTRLRQVLYNLVGNAIKFTEHGTVTLSLASAPLPDGRIALQIAVADNGVGIDPEVQPLLFRPFQQADDSTTRRFGGTGLGLAICRHLVESMGGEIGVDSRLGEGSTFRVQVRLEPAHDTAPAGPVRADTRWARSLRLLVAEDNPTNRLLIGTRLRRRGHQVTLADDGVQAVEAATRDDWDLILMDMQMPGLDGAGATRAIRALPGARGRVPIVALTADALPEFRARHMGCGLDDYLTKPIDWAALDATLARHAPRAAGHPPPPVAVADATDRLRSAQADRVDAGAVATMSEDLGEAVWRAVLEVYWPRAQSDADALRAAIAAGDVAARRVAAHSLKGASSSVGFASVAATAARLEACAPPDAPALMRRLDEALAHARADWGVQLEPVV